MPELLTTAVVAEELGKLVTAFPSNIAAKKNPAMLATTYREGLQGIDADALRGAVQMAIREDVYFPKVARLRELAGRWTKHNRPSFATRREERWDVCLVCGARAEPTEKGRTVMNHVAELHQVRRGEDGDVEGAA